MNELWVKAREEEFINDSLKELDLVRENFGDALLTRERLYRELLSIVENDAGRMTIHSLSLLLDVDSAEVERTVRMLGGSETILFNSAVIKLPYYYNILCAEISKILKEEETISLVSLASKLQIPVSFIDTIFTGYQERVCGTVRVSSSNKRLYHTWIYSLLVYNRTEYFTLILTMEYVEQRYEVHVWVPLSLLLLLK